MLLQVRQSIDFAAGRDERITNCPWRRGSTVAMDFDPRVIERRDNDFLSSRRGPSVPSGCVPGGLERYSRRLGLGEPSEPTSSHAPRPATSTVATAPRPRGVNSTAYVALCGIGGSTWRPGQRDAGQGQMRHQYGRRFARPL